MSVWAIAYRAQCDRCGTTRDNANDYDLRRQARDEGWGFGLRLDGSRAHRGGKDYCAQCRPGRESTGDAPGGTDG